MGPVHAPNEDNFEHAVLFCLSLTQTDIGIGETNQAMFFGIGRISYS